MLWLKVSQHKEKPLHLGCIYRPPSSPAAYWEKLECVLSQVDGDDIVLMGDLNVDFLSPTSDLFNSLNCSVLLPFGLQNVIQAPTLISTSQNSSLDVILTNMVAVHSGTVVSCDLSDHSLVHAIPGCSFSSDDENSTNQYVRHRRDFSHFDQNEFCNVLLSYGISEFSTDNSYPMWLEWSTKFTTSLDTIAPGKRVYCLRQRRCQFMTTDLLQLIRDR